MQPRSMPTWMPTTIPRYSGKQRGPATIGGQRDRPADRAPEVIPGEQGANESAAAFAPSTRKMIGATTNEKKTMLPTIAAIAST